jgi:hypothetical protein
MGVRVSLPAPKLNLYKQKKVLIGPFFVSNEIAIKNL